MTKAFHARAIGWLLLAPLFSLCAPACALLPQREEAPLRTYMLTLGPFPADFALSSSQTQNGTLLVSIPDARPGFDTSQMAYVQRPYEVEYFAHNQWVDTPAHMLGPLLARAFDETGVWKAVVQTPAAVQGDYRLDTEIMQWQQEFLTHPSRMRIAVRAQLVQMPQQRVVMARRFEVVEPASSDDPYGGVTAANRAVSQLVIQVAQWVNETVTGELALDEHVYKDNLPPDPITGEARLRRAF